MYINDKLSNAVREGYQRNSMKEIAMGSIHIEGITRSK